MRPRFLLRRHFILLLALSTCGLTFSLAQSNRQRFIPPSTEWLHLDSRSPYKIWLDQDVPWIITDEERAAFKLLRSDEERDSFIDAFWSRRDPTPDTLMNEYKIEHYHHIVYANEQFGIAGVPGWKSDRGRIYIMHGQPDQVESFPGSGEGIPVAKNRDVIESFPAVKDPNLNPADAAARLPLEVWHYRYLEGVGQDVTLRFVDTCWCGDFRMTMDPAEKGTLLYFPGDWHRTGKDRIAAVPPPVFTWGTRPTAKFLDLKKYIHGYVNLNPLPFEVRADVIKATDATSLLPITIAIRNRDITFVEDHERRRATLNISGQLVTPSDHVIEEFEDSIDLNLGAGESSSKEDRTLYILALAPRNDHYRLEIAIKDVHANRGGSLVTPLDIPDRPGTSFSTSSLVLAERIDPVSRDVDASGFVRLGSFYIRPYVGTEGEPLHVARGKEHFFWMQIYDLAVDQKARRTSVQVDYTIAEIATNKIVFHEQLPADAGQALRDQLTLRQKLPADLKPGSYRLDVQVRDGISDEALQRSTVFVID